MKACGRVVVQPHSGKSSLDGGVSGNIHARVTLPPREKNLRRPLNMKMSGNQIRFEHYGEEKAPFSLPRVVPPFLDRPACSRVPLC